MITNKTKTRVIIVLVLLMATSGVLVSVIVNKVAYANVKLQQLAKTYMHPDATVLLDSKGLPINENLIGFDGTGPSSTLGLIRAVRPKFIRTDVSFEGSFDNAPVYNCTNGSFNPALVFERLKLITELGATPILIVDYMPKCLAGVSNSLQNPNYSIPATNAGFEKWSNLVNTMAKDVISKYHVKYFEIWNEPDWTFFNNGVTGYETLYFYTARALEKAALSSEAKIYVGGPALANVAGSLDTSFLVPLLNYIMQYKLPFNFLSWHLYANDPLANKLPGTGIGPFCGNQGPGPNGNPCYYNLKLSAGVYGTETEQARSVLKNCPTLKPMLIIDEWNIDGEPEPRMYENYSAAFVSAVLNQAFLADLNAMCFYNAVNSGPLSQNFGVINSNFKPVPAYYGFKFWSLLKGSSLNVIISNGGNAFGPGLGGVGVVASKGNNKLNLLIYYFVPYDPTNNYANKIPASYGANVTVKLKGVIGDKSIDLRKPAIMSSDPKLTRVFIGNDNSNSFRVALAEESALFLSFRLNTTRNTTSTTLVVILSVLILIFVSFLTYYLIRQKNRKSKATSLN